MSQSSGDLAPHLSATSSFPLSSPSFWDQAATIPTPPAGTKRPYNGEGEVADGRDEAAISLAEGTAEGPAHTPLKKRARFATEDIDTDHELREITKAEQEDEQSEYSGNNKTTLSYLPNRTQPMALDDPHSYLANPEYAPNRFGDIGDYMRKKEIKVQTQNRDIALASAQAGIPQIFTGLTFYINGNTHPPMEELRKIILQRGGVVYPVLRSKGMVKFIIAPMLTQMKFKQFQNYRVVREGWIVESCQEGRLLDWSRWKLQAQGGWEAEGRKGMEGFLKGEASQRVVKEEDTSEKVEEEEEEEELEIADGSIKGKDEQEEGDATPKPAVQKVPPFTPVHTRTIATQSLLSPSRGSKIPISPGVKKEETPALEKIPPKIHKPEGAWEHYYTKESNEHAALALKNSEWRIKNTAERGNEGGFIDGYYQNSRLHHLSTWKSELKVLVAAAQRQSEENSLSKPSNATVSAYSLSDSVLPRAAPIVNSSGDRVIFHVDFDCFFVSCGLATRPHLKGKPSVVCHSQAGKQASSTSEIASASYEARAKGVKNGMSLGRARTLVGEDLQTIPYEFDTYKKFSLAFYTVLMAYADELQAVSVDEALIDVTSAVRARTMAPEEAGDSDPGETRPRDPAVEIADKIRDEVRRETNCEVSIGIAHNILLAKLATRAAKPAGVYHLTEPVVADFLAPLDVKDLPSVGYSTSAKIEEKFGTTTCGKLIDITKSAFQRLLGPKTGEMIYGYLRGMDDKKLEPHKERKSISAEMNYGIRFRNHEQAEICVKDLAAEVAKRMKQVNVKGRLLTLKLLKRHPDAPIEPPKFLGHGWCETFNKSTSIGNKGGSATDDPAILGSESVKLLRAMKLDPVELRGVGIQITKLDGEAKSNEREAGQGLLAFGKSKTEVSRQATPVIQEVDERPSKAEEAPLAEEAVIAIPSSPYSATHTSPSRTRSPSGSPPSIQVVNATAGPSRIPTSSDGIDPEFLAALPPELRQEVKRDFVRARTASERPESAPPTDDSPTKPKGKHAAAHITKQLRPQRKTHLTAAAVAELPLYGAWSAAASKGKEREEADDDLEKIGIYFVSELRDLGIDPLFLADLPPEMQKEVVDQERQRKRQRQMLHRPADTSRIRAREREKGKNRVSASVSPGRFSRGGSNPPKQQPQVQIGPTISRPPKPKLFNASTLPEVMDIVSRWIESRRGSGPAAKDADKVRAYLVKCMSQDYGLAGVEMAVEVLKFMRVVIEEKWEEGLVDNEFAVGDDLAGREWWETWRGFRAEVDRLSVERLGAGLRL